MTIFRADIANISRMISSAKGDGGTPLQTVGQVSNRPELVVEANRVYLKRDGDYRIYLGELKDLQANPETLLAKLKELEISGADCTDPENQAIMNLAKELSSIKVPEDQAADNNETIIERNYEQARKQGFNFARYIDNTAIGSFEGATDKAKQCVDRLTRMIKGLSEFGTGLIDNLRRAENPLEHDIKQAEIVIDRFGLIKSIIEDNNRYQEVSIDSSEVDSDNSSIQVTMSYDGSSDHEPDLAITLTRKDESERTGSFDNDVIKTGLSVNDYRDPHGHEPMAPVSVVANALRDFKPELAKKLDEIENTVGRMLYEKTKNRTK